jgi:hypothetical protein
VLTNRLTKVVVALISNTQNAFIPGKNILEGVAILHETIHELKRKKQKGIILKLDFKKAYDKVQWSFMLEVLEKKKFPPKWIEWIYQIVSGGRVGIDFNGEPGEFFRTYKCLRQGGSLFPLLLNLVADALAIMLKRGCKAGLIKGLIPELVEGGPTHLQYADDTVIFLEAAKKLL